MTITGLTASGTQVTITAPVVTSGETVAQYATALTNAIATAKIANVTVSTSSGQLSILGANMSTTGNIYQGLADSTINYNFGSTGTVNPATNLTIVGPTVSGSPATAITVAPTVFSGETVAEYATALNNALTSAGIKTGTDGVNVTSNGGQLTIVGPAASLKTSGTASQDLTATTVSYDFGSSKGVLATVDPTTDLTITGQTTDGSTATITAPTVLTGDTVAQYATALNSALTAAGITGVTVTNTATGVLSITGANLSTTGKVVQDPVASAAASGTLTFDSNGNLVSPASDVAGMTFSGLSDGAATMNINWGLYGTAGTGEISQTATASSSPSSTSQNGYPSGEYKSFAIDSSGLVTATYSNSQTQVVGQLAVATVINEQGLEAIGNTEYDTTGASGAASVGVAGTGGRGTIEGSSLEASNVNISAEFSDLIVAQRAFEANSKAVTTFDTITQETINMIH
jgi:flagellar hook protein FlgE